MTIILATRTLEAIDKAIEADGGASFRVWQGKVFPHMSDAFRGGVDEGYREHLGASMIGINCARKLWYSFRWAIKPAFSARILRLFNRGHLEEARFIALLLMIGAEVYQQDSNGKQYRISAANGHFGGSGDGIAKGIPDLPPDTYCLLEFKTHGEKSFLELKKKGLQVAKEEHFVQMQVYMRKMGLAAGLYMAVNKNTDEIYAQIVLLNPEYADQYIQRGVNIVYLPTAPVRIAKTIGHFSCTFCDAKQVCHNRAPIEKNCRTCAYSRPSNKNNLWDCLKHNVQVSKETQLIGCRSYEVNTEFYK